MKLISTISAILSFLPLLTLAQKQSDITKLRLLAAREKAVYVLPENMRDPYITAAPDGYYYLSATRGNKLLPGGKAGIQVFRSKNLAEWEDMGMIWETAGTAWGRLLESRKSAPIRNPMNPQLTTRTPMVWAPEMYFIQNRWVILATSNLERATLITNNQPELKGPFSEPFDTSFGHRHDPSLFLEDNGIPWLVYGATKIQPLKTDFSGYAGNPVSLSPSNRRIGHEGSFILKIENKYLLFGTGWSRDTLRKGTYNLYYCVADSLTGPYGPRQFAGRFLGHGNIFRDKNGHWWCTAFENGDYIAPDALPGSTHPGAFTINRPGLTLVPMRVYSKNGTIMVEPEDDLYRIPGKDEIQAF